MRIASLFHSPPRVVLRPRVRFARFLATCSLAAVIAAGAFARVSNGAPVAVPNGDFSDAGNFGSVGGGAIGGSGTDVTIGAGPWLGSYAGVLGLLAPPTLTISNGAANISGLAAANLFGIFNNGGYFSQTLSTNYQTQERYTLTATVDTGTPLDIGLLASGNFGLALGSGGTTLASTASAPPQLVDLQPVGGTTYQLTLLFDSGDTTTGAIDVQLFAEPQQLIGATLFSSVTFGTVTLDATAINPSAGTIVAVDPTPQSTMVGQAFANPLQVRVTDVNGDPVPGATVTYTAPASGASASLSAQTVMTDNNGLASVTATANTVAGSYAVSASVEGVDTPASFSLTNTPGPAAVNIAAQGDGQSAPVNTPFPEPLVVLVTDAFGNAVEGVDVAFSAPGSGASAMLSAPSATTDANGLAQVTATANGTPGSYAVTATVSGVSPAASFSLNNRVDVGTTITGGSGDGQSANINGEFLCALSVTVTNVEGAPQPGYAVDFTAPDTGASATLFNGVVSGTTVRALTDASGIASVRATANDVPGQYIVTAQLVDSSVGPVNFTLTNIDGLIFRSGFDTPCAPPP